MFQSPATPPSSSAGQTSTQETIPFSPSVLALDCPVKAEAGSCSASKRDKQVGDLSILVLPIFLAAPNMVVWHIGLGSRMPEGYRDSWLLFTLGMEPQDWSQAPTAQARSDYVRKDRLYFWARGP